MSIILTAVENISSSGSGSYPGIYKSHTISPYSRPFSVSAGGGSITVTYNVDFSIFPLQYIDYLNTSGKVVRIQGITALEQLPDPKSSPEIIKMREDNKSSVEYTLTVYSYDTITDEEGNSSTEDYTTIFTIVINANYDTSRDLLLAKINARR